jgi:hypothetical protein
MRILKSITSCLSMVALVACGGGGGGSDSVPRTSVAYFDFNGYTWSSTTNDIYPNPPSFQGSALEVDANSYCSKSTCDVDQYGRSVNCRATNFNGQTGWSLPTEAQLVSFCQAFLKNPVAGWVSGPTWSSCTGGLTSLGRCVTVDFANACKTFAYINNPTNTKGHVTCIKKIG